MLKEFKEFAMRATSWTWRWASSSVRLRAHCHVTGERRVHAPDRSPDGKVDFSSLFWNLSGTGYTSLAEAKKAGAPVIGYGAFLNTILDFILVALVIFLLNQAGQPVQEGARAGRPNTKDCPYCLSAVRSRRPAAPTAHPSCRSCKPAFPGAAVLLRRSTGCVRPIRRRGGHACRPPSSL